MKTKCPKCGKSELVDAPFPMVRKLDGRRFAAELPARRCVSCGESLVRGPALLAFEHALALELARSGSVGPEGFRFLRRLAGLDGKRLAALLDVTPSQVSRWENGRKPLERRAVALVSALATERIEERPRTRALLEALAAPHGKLPKRGAARSLGGARLTARAARSIGGSIAFDTAQAMSWQPSTLPPPSQSIGRADVASTAAE